MITGRELFLRHIAQTSVVPMLFEVERGEGLFLFDRSGKRYIDLISGISVSNLGHHHPKIVTAIKEQSDKYLHTMVYGEHIQSPQVQLANLLTHNLPPHLDSVYFVNSGAEAVEGAMKLAKRYTGRTEIISFRKAYHGSTQGALSIIGDEYFRNAFRPLLPDITQLDFNRTEQLNVITEHTACVIAEPVQGEAGVIPADKNFLKALRQHCNETNTLLVFDEIQTGMGRTGTLFAFEQYGVTPDILLLAKALGGGLPLGAFISSREIMWSLTDNPYLGHITTFGGNPLCCAAGLAAMHALLEEGWIKKVKEKEQLFLQLLQHSSIKNVRSTGLLIAVELENAELTRQVIDRCMQQGVIMDWFLFSSNSLRIAPPLLIDEETIRLACAVIVEAINTVITG